MKKNITPNDCKSMFTDKFRSLSMRDLGMELKHFSIGTAPEFPSLLVNQESLKSVLIDKFSTFFNPERSQGLEIIYLKSNYGNGKSHFLRTIQSFLSNYENIITKQVFLKQEKTDLKTKVLEAISRKMIKDCAVYLIHLATEESLSNERESVISTLSDKFNISAILAKLLYESAVSEDISTQSKAIAILKRNHLPEYLKTLTLKPKDLGSEFYSNVIRLICIYLDKNNFYLVITLDEYEHVYSWKDAQARKSFFEDIKLFYDCIATYRNLFFIFGESESSSSESVSSDDPAYFTRKKGQTYQIENVSSEAEVEKLLKMIKIRYEKYYELSLDAYMNDIVNAINEDVQVKTNSNYREYTKCIMRVFDQYRNLSSQSCKTKKKPLTLKPNTINEHINVDEITTSEEKWKSVNSISRKSILFDALEYILNKSNETIINQSKRRGFYQTKINEITINYHIFVTNMPSSADFIKRYNEVLSAQLESNATRIVIMYPYKDDMNDKFKYENTFFYDINKIPSVLEKIYANSEKIEDVFSYLNSLELRC